MCFSEKNVQWNRAEAPVAGVGNFVAVNQTLTHHFISSFSNRVYMYKKDISPENTCQSHHCNISEALTEAPFGVAGSSVKPAWK